MALLRRSRQGRTGDARRDSPVSPRAPSSGGGGRHEVAAAEPSRLGAGLERRWEEAWRRARAGQVK